MGTPSPRNGAVEYLYERIWPIVDDSRPLSVLTAEAGPDLSYALGELGVRPTRQPRWIVTDDLRLVCQVPVLALGDDAAEGVDEDAVRQQIAAGKPDGHIAAELGVPRSAVEEIRSRLESDAVQPAGVGVAG